MLYPVPAGHITIKILGYDSGERNDTRRTACSMAAVAFAARNCGVRALDVSVENDADGGCFTRTLAPTVRLDEDDGRLCAAYGMHATCRYLGVHSSLMPSDPEAALVVDGALEALSVCVHEGATGARVGDIFDAYRGDPEEAEDGASLIGFDMPTVADFAWFGFLQGVHKEEEQREKEEERRRRGRRTEGVYETPPPPDDASTSSASSSSYDAGPYVRLLEWYLAARELPEFAGCASACRAAVPVEEVEEEVLDQRASDRPDSPDPDGGEGVGMAMPRN